MKIPGWAYIAVGTFVSLFSGYIYKFVLRPDGTKNMSMAVFFFVGIIFIIVGFIRSFFKKMDYEQDVKFERDSEELQRRLQQQAHHTRQHAQKQTQHETLQHHNKVEEQVNNEYQKQYGPHPTHQHSGHTSQYARTHSYHRIQSGETHPQEVSQMSIQACHKCGLKNPVSTNYCHGCGNRLK